MAKRVIVLRGEPTVDEQHTASIAITPGMLIEVNAGQFRPHGSAAGAAAPVFALERDELGKTIDVDYAAGDRVKAGYFDSDDRVNALVASGDVISDGDELESDGAGRLKKGTTKPVARAAEDHVLGTTRLACTIVV